MGKVKGDVGGRWFLALVFVSHHQTQFLISNNVTTFTQVDSVLPMTVTGKWFLCLFLNPWAFPSYFLPHAVEKGEWVSGLVGIWHLARVNPPQFGRTYVSMNTALKHLLNYLTVFYFIQHHSQDFEEASIYQDIWDNLITLMRTGWATF